MKILHLADLHLGKKVNGFSMIEDQKYILEQIIEITDVEKPDVIIIAGDIYDKAIPPIEAVELLDEFIFKISERKINTLIISGNHDSPERLAFGAKIINLSKIYISPAYNGEISKITLEDENGEVNFYLLPFVKPANVRRFFTEEKIGTYTDAIRVIVEKMEIDVEKRNILVAHQFVTGASRTESEEISVGGLDNVEASVFEKFDYVALGHIHRPQNIGGNERIRYCGTPLKYSFSEINDKKSVSIIEMKSKEDFELKLVELTPKRDMRKIKGEYAEIVAKENYENTNVDDYIQVVLTDEEEIPDVIQKLRNVYKNVMKLEYDNKRTQENSTFDFEIEVENKSPIEIFSEFYKIQNNQEMNDEQMKIVVELMEKVWED